MNFNKGIELEMDVTNKSKVITALKNNEIDFALVSSIPDDIQLDSESLMENKLFLVGGSQLQYSDAFAMKSLLQDMPLILSLQIAPANCKS